MDGAAVSGADEAGAFDFDDIDADGIEPFGGRGVSGGDEEFHGFEDDAGLGARELKLLHGAYAHERCLLALNRNAAALSCLMSNGGPLKAWSTIA